MSDKLNQQNNIQDPQTDTENFLYQNYRIIAAIIFVFLTVFVIIIDNKIIPSVNKTSANYEFAIANWKRAAEFIVHFLPILAIFVLIKPLTDFYEKIREKKREIEFEKNINPIRTNVEKVDYYLSKYHKYKEIKHFEISYQDLNWKKILQDAITVDLCVFYASSDWYQKNLSAFGSFLKSNGTLNIYLPNPISISDQFFEKSDIKLDISNKILRTARKFREKHQECNSGKLNITFLDKGFNYMYANVVKPNSGLFLYSPYQNIKSNNQSPVLILNKLNMHRDLENFIVEELGALTIEDQLNDFEKSKYIIWDKDKNRVFISSALSCPLNCSFCYVPSIADESAEIPINDLGRQLAKAIVTDPRFKPGEMGTTILLGGFTEPFLTNNLFNTIDIIKGISKFKNYIHISTRIGIGRNAELRNLLKNASNIILNYSFASLDLKIEAGNFDYRFSNMEEFKNDNIKTAIYIRPVIPNITMKYIPDIIKKAKEVGITHVTIGGLYIDNRIKAELDSLDIELPELETLSKNFVLDDKQVLKKLIKNDVEEILKIFSNEGFQTFKNSTELVNHFRNRS